MTGDAARRPEDLFAGFDRSLDVCTAVQRAVDALGGAERAVSTSQVAFRRRRAFAYVWRPGQYVHSDVAAVLSLALPREIVSDRFKEVVHPSRAVWVHHLELTAPSEVDDQVRAWLAEAYASAG